MNKSWWVAMVGMVVGMQVSAAITYRLAGKRFDERLERETQLIKELYSGAIPAFKTIGFGSPPQPEKALDEIEPELEFDEPSTEAEAWTEYNKLIKPYSPSMPDNAEVDEDGTAYWTETDAREDWVEKQSNEPIRVITVQEFEERQNPDHPGYIYDSIFLVYYAGDDTLVDDQDVPVNDVAGVVGDALNHFGYGSDTEDNVFVLNEHMNAMYEIERDPRAFVEVIGGIA